MPKDDFQAVKLQRPARIAVCSHSRSGTWPSLRQINPQLTLVILVTRAGVCPLLHVCPILQLLHALTSETKSEARLVGHANFVKEPERGSSRSLKMIGLHSHANPCASQCKDV
jgi:hypothetical protein